MMKTGSTSIQAAFHGYDDGRLRYLPHSMRNHSSLLRNVLKDQPFPTLRTLGKEHTAEELEAQRRKERRRFRRMISEDDRDLIISSEELTTTFSRPNLKRLKRLLDEQFDDIRVIAYVREPVSFMSSIFQQRTKMGRIGFEYADMYPDYRHLFAKWVELVGTDAIEAIQFHRSQFHEEDLVSDFANRVGADPSQLVSEPSVLNQTLTAEALSVLYAFRVARGNPRDYPMLAKHNARAIKFLQGFGSRPFQVGLAGCMEEIERRHDDIAWVENLMGSTFIYRDQPLRGGVEFTSERDVLDFADEVTPMLVDRVNDAYAGTTGRVSTMVEALDLLYSQRPPSAADAGPA